MSSSRCNARACCARAPPTNRYGFAHAKPEEQARWNGLTEHYFSQRSGGGASLGAVCLLVDARHGLKQADRDFLKGLRDLQASVCQRAVILLIAIYVFPPL